MAALCENKWFSSMKHDVYIEILRYGRSKIGEPITFDELKSHLESEGYEFDDFAAEQFFSDLFVDKGLPRGNKPGQLRNEGEFFLEHEGYFNLLEYEELIEARRSATQATLFAAIAIIISTVSTGASIYFSRLQLERPTQIDEFQVHKVLATIELERKSINGQIQGVESAVSELKMQVENLGAHNKSMQPTPPAAAD
ncbi:hypothetical protein HCU74_01720 [Spongiibacter sp. KMU-166]|uniref:Uncharacterized protein n=1 Tax=Spongiibacter thalassae TaxID=2721624 RepID=A0ABX1GAE1_9GAMM|nr:hypothetical protein [Spongiibacter thalassae]NKI16127.1 hypothetical protein [Spongiibacter thalassae]